MVGHESNPIVVLGTGCLLPILQTQFEQVIRFIVFMFKRPDFRTLFLCCNSTDPFEIASCCHACVLRENSLH